LSRLLASSLVDCSDANRKLNSEALGSSVSNL